MKNNIKILLASLMLMTTAFISNEAGASENLELVIIENSPLMRVEVKNPSSEEIDVYLFNEKNKAIFRERVGMGETFETQFDFTSLENGTYKLISEVENMRVNRVLEVTGSQVNLIDTYYSFTPVFSQEDDKLIVHFVNNGGADIGVSVEREGEDLYDAYYNNGDEVFSKAYSLQKLIAGTYKFKLSSQGEFYTHEFVVD